MHEAMHGLLVTKAPQPKSRSSKVVAEKDALLFTVIVSAVDDVWVLAGQMSHNKGSKNVTVKLQIVTQSMWPTCIKFLPRCTAVVVGPVCVCSTPVEESVGPKTLGHICRAEHGAHLLFANPNGAFSTRVESVGLSWYRFNDDSLEVAVALESGAPSEFGGAVALESGVPSDSAIKSNA